MAMDRKPWQVETHEDRVERVLGCIACPLESLHDDIRAVRHAARQAALKKVQDRATWQQAVAEDRRRGWRE
jgi:hypothetical protein